MPTFDARGLVPTVLPGAPMAQKPMEVSSGESRGEGEEEVDSEKTPEEGETPHPDEGKVVAGGPWCRLHPNTS